MLRLVENILVILFAFALETALQTAGRGLSQVGSVEELFAIIAAAPGLYLFGCVQVLAFIATLCRFFFGAYRFHSEAHVEVQRDELRDAAWTVILFIAFYVAALLVTQQVLFALAIGMVHVVDMMWFLLTQSANKQILKAGQHYLCYDVVTLFLLGVIVVWHTVAPFSPALFSLWVSIVLLGVSTIDILGPTSDWYFSPEKWKENHG